MVRVRTLNGFPRRAFAPGGLRVDTLSGSGGDPTLTPDFWVPLNDLGSGIVDISVYASASVPTFTRGSVAWTRLANGLWTSIASGSPRSYYTAAGVYGGFFPEVTTTNRCLHSRDLTNVVWVAVNVTAAKDQVGLDGVSNSCSLLTATGAGGTLLQTVVAASATRVYSAWIKRSVGTGTLEMAVDGVTWVDVTSQVGVGSFALCQISQAAVTNPIMGFRIGSSGDAFIVDMCQEETQGKATSPIPCTTTAQNRSGDRLDYTLGSEFNFLEGSFIATVLPVQLPISSSRTVISCSNDAFSERIEMLFSADSLSKGRITIFDGGASQVDVSTTNAFTLDVLNKCGIYYKANDFGVVTNGGTFATDVTGTVPTPTRYQIGCLAGASNQGGCGIRDVKYFGRRLTQAQLQGMTNAS